MKCGATEIPWATPYIGPMAKLALLSLALLLAGCGGMSRAVGVVPNTFDDLAAKRAAARGEQPPAPPAP